MPVPVISAAVEGIVDEAVASRLILHVGGRPGAVYGKVGKATLRNKINGYNNAAKHSPWFVLVDLNGEADCARPLLQAWLPVRAPNLCFRVAVRQVEAWLMADAEMLAKFLRAPRAEVPANPEAIQNAKAAMVNIARKSKQSAMKDDMVPRHGSGRSVGPAYSSRLIEYATKYWRPEVAEDRAESLKRAIQCLKRLVDSASREA